MLRAEQIEPVDAPITKVLAKKIYRDYMLQTGRLDKDEISEHIEYFVEEMTDHVDELVSDRDDCQERLADEKKELAEAKTTLKLAKDENDREYWEDEIRSLEEEVQSLEVELAECRASISAFRTDKRAFLVEYINREVFADEWESERDKVLKADAERLGKCYRMKYKDATGAITERDTGPLVPEGTGLLVAYCFLRGEKRTFRVSRIVQLRDLRVNMVVDPRSVFTTTLEKVPTSAPAASARPENQNAAPVPPLRPAKRSVSFLLGLGVFVMPYIFAWLLLRPGYSAKPRIIGFVWMSVMLASILYP